ncbi:hypothetical protein MMPV_005569 [Pyropia vietnamensis]
MWAFALPAVPMAVVGSLPRGAALGPRRAPPFHGFPLPAAIVCLFGRRLLRPPPSKKPSDGSGDDDPLAAAIAAAAAAREAADRDRDARAVAAEFATPSTPRGGDDGSSSPPPTSPVDDDMAGLRERLDLLATRERDWEGVKDQLADLERMSGLRLTDGAGEPTAAAWVFCALCVVVPLYLAWMAYSGLANAAASLTGTKPLL